MNCIWSLWTTFILHAPGDCTKPRSDIQKGNWERGKDRERKCDIRIFEILTAHGNISTLTYIDSNQGHFNIHHVCHTKRTISFHFIFLTFHCIWLKSNLCVPSWFSVRKLDAVLLVNSCQSLLDDVCVVGDGGRPGPRPVASWGCLRAKSQAYPPDWAPAGCYQLESWRAEPGHSSSGLTEGKRDRVGGEKRQTA